MWRAANRFGIAKILPDKAYLKIMFRIYQDKKLNLKNPKTFNEKLQWIKLYDRKSKYSEMVDKYEAKKYVKKIIGEQYIIPTIGVWNSFDEIDFDSLPDQFVLKCTHDSGGLVICKDKNAFDKKAAKEKIKRCMKREYYYSGREWPYLGVKHKIIAEPYIMDSTGELNDYKFFCFNGKVKCLKVDFGRYVEHHANYYDDNMHLLPFGEAALPPIPEQHIEKPAEFEEMKRIAEVLSKDHLFLRVDLYDVDGKLYFGELTFFPASGVGVIAPKEWDLKLGSWMNLPYNKPHNIRSDIL